MTDTYSISSISIPAQGPGNPPNKILPIVVRERCVFDNINTVCTGQYNDVIVEGGRVSAPGVNQQFLQEKLSSGMSNQNGNDWFIPR